MNDPIFSLEGKKVWVAGHKGMVGSSVVRRLQSENCEVLTATRSELDLTRQRDVEDWVADHQPDAIFLAAARVGGILANDTCPAEFIYNNLAIETNVIHAAWVNGVKKLQFLGSSCIYPRLAPQPIVEDALLSGPLEPTNEWYAVAKIAGIKMCQAYRLQYGCDFISAQPTNLYGYGDNFNLQASHVIPALVSKAHTAKTSGADEMVVWGTGEPLREFLFIDDLADALVFLMKHYSEDIHINVGSGHEFSIRESAELVAKVVGFEGKLVFDPSRPDGIPRKLLDTSRINAMGWQAQTGLREGLESTYSWFLENQNNHR